MPPTAAFSARARPVRHLFGHDPCALSDSSASELLKEAGIGAVEASPARRLAAKQVSSGFKQAKKMKTYEKNDVSGLFRDSQPSETPKKLWLRGHILYLARRLGLSYGACTACTCGDELGDLGLNGMGPLSQHLYQVVVDQGPFTTVDELLSTLLAPLIIITIII